MKPCYLVLAHDRHFILECIKAGLCLDNSTIITPRSNDPLPQILEAAHLIEMDDYQNTGLLELITHQAYQRTPFQKIITGHEFDLIPAARLRYSFGIEGQNYNSVLAFRDKILMKDLLCQAGIEVPAYKELHCASDIIEFITDHGYPVIIKPRRGAWANRTAFVSNAKELETFLTLKEKFLDTHHTDLEIEKFIKGKMYHVNGLVVNGKMTASWPCIYLTQTLQMLEGNHGSSYLLSAENPLVDRLNEYTKKVLSALPTPLNTGFHLEVFIDANDKIIFCEIASRTGGKGVNSAWKGSFGVDLQQEYIRMQAGLSVSTLPQSLSPQILTGETWFPQRLGTLKHVPSTCPFDWVKEYDTFYQPGKPYAFAKDISECIAGVSLLVASSEKEMEERLKAIHTWFWYNCQWEETQERKRKDALAKNYTRVCK